MKRNFSKRVLKTLTKRLIVALIQCRSRTEEFFYDIRQYMYGTTSRYYLSMYMYAHSHTTYGVPARYIVDICMPIYIYMHAAPRVTISKENKEIHAIDTYYV